MTTTSEKRESVRPTSSSLIRKDKQLFNVAGVLLQFLASPEEVGDTICVIRGTMPPGVVVPLHRHEDLELLYVLEGTLEAYRSSEGTPGWTSASVGDVVVIPGNVKHALRNTSSVPVTLAVVTKSELYAFFRELAKPFDPNLHPASPTAEEIQELFAVAAKHGYWLASPEENAAIGLRMV
jgi:quercetin dioxygenase-like cupin family protein